MNFYLLASPVQFRVDGFRYDKGIRVLYSCFTLHERYVVNCYLLRKLEYARVNNGTSGLVSIRDVLASFIKSYNARLQSAIYVPWKSLLFFANKLAQLVEF
jgi:hypothetical protein